MLMCWFFLNVNLLQLKSPIKIATVKELSRSDRSVSKSVKGYFDFGFR